MFWHGISDPYKISFCTTCKDRLEFLKKTLPANLEACKDYPNVEFVILDYDCPKGTAEWVKSTFPDEIHSGRIRVARHEPAPDFKMSHAKNMAHRLATGDILVNLDADNLLTPGTAEWLNREFHKNFNVIVRPSRLATALLNHSGLLECAGLYGRIAMSGEMFKKVRGYNEERYNGYGGDDEDILNRVRLTGTKHISPPIGFYGTSLPHSDELRVEHMSAEDVARSASKIESNNRSLSSRMKAHHLIDVARGYPIDPTVPIQANPTGEMGCGRVKINFDDDYTEVPPATSAL